MQIEIFVDAPGGATAVFHKYALTGLAWDYIFNICLGKGVDDDMRDPWYDSILKRDKNIVSFNFH